MGKLIFTHGVMDAGKSAMLIQKAYQFNQKGRRVVVIKPTLDTRSATGKVESDIGISWDAIDICPEDSVEARLRSVTAGIQVVLVDEAQFLQERQVDELAKIADCGVLVIAFGLKNDFQGHLFSATKRLIELADRVDEIPSMCKCGKKATHHYLKDKEKAHGSIAIGGDELFISCCRKCFNELRGK